MLLQKFRNLSNSLPAKILMIFLLVIFMVWGVGDIFNHKSEVNLVKIKDQKPITKIEFFKQKEKELRKLAQMTDQPITEEFEKANNINQYIISALIKDRLMNVMVKNYDIDFSDNLIIKLLKQTPDFSEKEGVFDNKLFNRFLQHNGLSKSSYIEQYKNRIAKNLLTLAFTHNSYIPPVLTNLTNFYLGEERLCDVFIVSSTNIIEKIIPKEPELIEAYEKHIKEFTLAETREIKLLILSQEQLMKDIKIAPGEVEKLYKENIKDFSESAKYTYYLASFSNYEEANKVLSQLKGEKDYKELLPKLVNKKLEEIFFENINEDDINPSLAKVLSTSTKESIVNVDSAYKLIKPIKITPAKVLTLKEARPKIEEDLKKQVAEKKFKEAIDIIDDKISSGEDFEKIAKDLNLTIESHLIKQGEELKSSILRKEVSPEIVNLGFNMNEEESSENIQFMDPMLSCFVHVSKINQSRVLEFNEVKAQVEKLWEADKSYQLNLEKIQNLIAANDYSMLTKGNIVKEVKFKRTQNESWSKELVRQIFNSPKHSFTNVVYNEGKFYFAYVKNIESDEKNASVKTIDYLKNEMQNIIFEDLMIYFYKKQNVKILDSKLD